MSLITSYLRVAAFVVVVPLLADVVSATEARREE
jgi:hypothetical protein